MNWKMIFRIVLTILASMSSVSSNNPRLRHYLGSESLYDGDNVAEFLEIARDCIDTNCASKLCLKNIPQCCQEAIEDLQVAYDKVKGFHDQIGTKWESVILSIISGTAVCCALYLFIVGHFTIRGTWIFRVLCHKLDHHDFCNGIPMEIYLKMEHETLFNNDPRLKIIEKAEKIDKIGAEIPLDKSVEEFFNERPYLQELWKNPSTLAELLEISKKCVEEEDDGHLHQDIQLGHHIEDNERMEAEAAMQQIFDMKTRKSLKPMENEHDIKLKILQAKEKEHNRLAHTIEKVVL